jgi:hypothetical protein
MRCAFLTIGVTVHPTAEWITRQLNEACGWEETPIYLIRDRDGAYGDVFKRRLRAMGIRDKPTAPRSPWQNGHCERLLQSQSNRAKGHFNSSRQFDVEGLVSLALRYKLTPQSSLISPKRVCLA